MNENKLIVIDGETLMDMRLPPQRFCIQTLLPQGLSILSGASKIGKSWMALDMCLHVAKGEPMWNQPTTSGTVLYFYGPRGTAMRGYCEKGERARLLTVLYRKKASSDTEVKPE